MAYFNNVYIALIVCLAPSTWGNCLSHGGLERRRLLVKVKTTLFIYLFIYFLGFHSIVWLMRLGYWSYLEPIFPSSPFARRQGIIAIKLGFDILLLCYDNEM